MPDMEVTDGNRRERIPINFPANSRKSREQGSERPRPKPVVSGEAVKERKPGILGRLARDFVQDDAHSLAEYVILEVLVPAAKNLVLDILNKGGERMLYGISRPNRTGAARGFYNYGGVPQQGRTADPRPPLSQQARSRHRYDEVLLNKREDADDVLEGLRLLIDQYGSASVTDFYDLLGRTSESEFTDSKWGWEDLRRASVRTVRGGYVLDLPDTVPLA